MKGVDKMNRETPIQNFNIIISKPSKLDMDAILNTILEYFSESNYFYIFHDKDTDDNGELKKPHYHLRIESNKRIRKSTLLNMLNERFNTDGVQIEKCENLISSVQYLIHLNDADKYQYDIDEVHTNNKDRLELLINSKPQNKATDDEIENGLIDLILECNYSLVALYYRLGASKMAHYLSLIKALIEELKENEYKSRNLDESEYKGDSDILGQSFFARKTKAKYDARINELEQIIKQQKDYINELRIDKDDLPF